MSTDLLTATLMDKLPAITPDIEKMLVNAAELWQLSAVQVARQDDPHRVSAAHRQFDVRPHRQMSLRYLPNGKIRVSLWLVGVKGGEEAGIEICAQEIPGVLAVGAGV